ncbi:ABC transporter substrate-binding protein [Tamaricihabitans halophyticus]|uniref:ABC transporter substrate-binding protein n=1 Tax=Tamaricihabitans halophyticus TaxID=1262583 RepID=UPI00140534B1|nr:ABC transporter substrate-binding protein [Tamaricihabitans halophyticus]
MRRIRNTAALTLAALVTTVSISACDLFSGDPSNEVLGPRESLRIAVTSAIDTAGLRIGVKDGVFDRAGLDIELVEQPTEQAAMGALDSGDADLAFGSNTTLLRAAQDGAELELEAEAYQARPYTAAIVSMPGSGYDEPQDKPQPRIAVDTSTDNARLSVNSLLSVNGVDPAGVDFVPRDRGDIAEALTSGAVDGAWLAEPYLTSIQQELGATVVLDGSSGAMQDYPFSSYATNQSFANKKGAVLQRFRQALGEAHSATTPTRVQQELPTFAEVDPATAALVTVGEYPAQFNQVRVQRVADLMMQYDQLPDRLDVYELTPAPLRS